MPTKILRVVFILACITMGIIWARYLTDEAEGLLGNDRLSSQIETREELEAEASGLAKRPARQFPWLFLGGFAGCALALTTMFLLHFVTQEIFERISPALVAIVLAMTTGYAVAQYILMWWPGIEPNVRVFVVVTLMLVFGYMGLHFGLTRASNWESLKRAVIKRSHTFVSPKIVDTSVIIDGRIADICTTGFIEGTLIIPRFVLKELQNIADSADVLRRAKGRRGLDILKAMQEQEDRVHIMVVEDDPFKETEVDAKLLKLAEHYSAKIITNDYNLNKVAQIEGVAVLNINDLANAVKPAVLPDEPMEVKVVKEGKEAFQGVGYLDDGTMIVVDGGKDYVGKEVAVIVTSVLQTAAGRMIFTKFSHRLP